MERAHAGIGIAVSLGLCLVLPGCSDGEAERRADCAKISSALSATADPSAEQVLEALRKVRPGLEDDEIAEHVDTVIASGAKDLASDGKAEMSDDEALRFAEAAERIRDACGLSG